MTIILGRIVAALIVWVIGYVTLDVLDSTAALYGVVLALIGWHLWRAWGWRWQKKLAARASY